MRNPRPRRVAVLVETSRSYGRDILRGVNRFMAEQGQWSLYLELRGLDSGVPRWLSSAAFGGERGRYEARALLARPNQP